MSCASARLEPGMRDPTVLEHVDVLRRLQHLHRILLGDEDRDAVGVDSAQDVENVVDDARCKAERGLVQDQ